MGAAVGRYRSSSSLLCVLSVCFFIQKQLNSLPPWKKWPQNKSQYLKIQCFKKYEKK